METLGVFVGTSWGGTQDAPGSWWRLGLGTEAQGPQVAPSCAGTRRGAGGGAARG